MLAVPSAVVSAMTSLAFSITPGWPVILSSLKGLVETGKPLEFGLSA